MSRQEDEKEPSFYSLPVWTDFTLRGLQVGLLNGVVPPQQVLVVSVPLSTYWWSKEAYEETVQDAQETWFLKVESVSTKRKLFRKDYMIRVSGPAWKLLAWSLTIYEVPRRGGHV